MTEVEDLAASQGTVVSKILVITWMREGMHLFLLKSFHTPPSNNSILAQVKGRGLRKNLRPTPKHPTEETRE
jgi:hypothetical protein